VGEQGSGELALEPCLPEHRAKRALRHVPAVMTGDGDNTGLRRVAELAVAALAAGDQKPAVRFDALHDVTHLHRRPARRSLYCYTTT